MATTPQPTAQNKCIHKYLKELRGVGSPCFDHPQGPIGARRQDGGRKTRQETQKRWGTASTAAALASTAAAAGAATSHELGRRQLAVGAQVKDFHGRVGHLPRVGRETPGAGVDAAPCSAVAAQVGAQGYARVVFHVDAGHAARVRVESFGDWC